MAQETLKITITADNQQAVKNIQETVTATNNLGKAFKTLPNTSNQATNALTNLSRVAQDAPYGFIGIANNLNPLLESFQRLQKESGSTTSALKSMAQGLMGPAGIGLAIGVVSSLFVAFGSQIADFILETSAAEKAQSKLNDTIAKGAGDVALETTKLETLVGIVTDVTKSTQERERALKTLQNSYKGNLELQKIDINDGAALKLVIDNITAALKRKAMAQAFATLIAEEEVKKARLQLESLKEMRDKVGGVAASWEFIKTAIKNAGSAMGAIEYNVNVTNKALDTHSEALKNTDSNLGVLNEKYKSVVGEQIKFNDAVTLSNTSLKTQVTEVNNLNRGLQNFISLQQAMDKLGKGGNIPLPTGGGLPSGAAPQNLPQGGIKPAQSITDAADLLAAQQAADSLNAQLEKTGILTAAIGGEFSMIFEDMMNGVNIGDALAASFKRILIQMVEMVAQALIFKAVFAAVSGGSSIALGSAADMVGNGSAGGLLGNWVLKGSDLILATQRAGSNLNIKRGS